MAFRHGQWVKFDNEVPGAFVTADGKVVGVYQRATTDATGGVSADRVMVVGPDGGNISFIQDGTIASVQFAPADLDGLEAVMTADDLPASRRPAPGYKFEA